MFLRSLLEKPFIYTLSQWFWYRPGQQRQYVENWIRPRPGARILDIGCGPGRLLDFMPGVHYVGYDPNPLYIQDAAKRFEGRGHFRCGYFTALSEDESGSFDIVLANGVLHHVADDAVHQLLSLAQKALKPNGRMITRDGCFESTQSRMAHFLLQSDRGGFVRTPQGYETLFRPHLNVKRSSIIRDALRLPYSLIHYELVQYAHG